VKRRLTYGMVAAGNLSLNWVARLPGLPECLGPVKGTSSFRVASRLVNSLGAGFAVKDYDPLGDVDVVLMVMPDAAVMEACRAMAATRVDWTGRTILLCSVALDASFIEPLRRRGALTASVFPAEGVEENALLFHGCREAAKALKPLIAGAQVRVVELADKGQYVDGHRIATSVVTGVIATAHECLLASGLEPALALAGVDQLVRRTLQGYIKAGRRGRLLDSDGIAHLGRVLFKEISEDGKARAAASE